MILHFKVIRLQHQPKEIIGENFFKFFRARHSGAVDEPLYEWVPYEKPGDIKSQK